VTLESLRGSEKLAERLGFRTDNDSYHYACAGKHVVRLEVHAWDKNVSLHAALWPTG
jgi:hypothetical protein